MHISENKLKYEELKFKFNSKFMIPNLSTRVDFQFPTLFMWSFFGGQKAEIPDVNFIFCFDLQNSLHCIIFSKSSVHKMDPVKVTDPA